MAKTVIGVYCEKKIYSVVLKDTGDITTESISEHDGRLRHFRFIKYLKSLEFDLCVIVQNEEAQPITNYLRREGKRPYLTIEYSPIPEQVDYKSNPDLPTIARKLAYRKKLNSVVFSADQVDLEEKIEKLGSGEEAIHLRSLDEYVLAWMAGAHGLFTLEGQSKSQ